MSANAAWMQNDSSCRSSSSRQSRVSPAASRDSCRTMRGQSWPAPSVPFEDQGLSSVFIPAQAFLCWDPRKVFQSGLQKACPGDYRMGFCHQTADPTAHFPSVCQQAIIAPFLHLASK